MKIRFWRLAALVAIALASPAVLRGETADLNSNYDSAEAPATVDSVAATYAAEAPPAPTADGDPQPVPAADGVTSGSSCCGNCGSCCDSRRPGPYSEPCPRYIAYGFSGVDAWRGLANGAVTGNYGVVNGVNAGGALLEDWGIGGQFGGSYNVYNFSGNGSAAAQFTEDTQQWFFTTGLFRRADCNHHFSWGLVHDWMVADNLGQFGHSFTLSQWRGQAAWAFGPKNEVGMWATIEDRFVTKLITTVPGVAATPVSYQAIDQGNLFFHHKFNQYGADAWFNVGIPLNARLQQTPAVFNGGGVGGSIGSFILGTNWLIPINDRLSAYMNATYMKPSAHRGGTPVPGLLNLIPGAAYQEYWNIGFGIAAYTGRAARSATVAGRQWMPYMPVANNGTFMTDKSQTF